MSDSNPIRVWFVEDHDAFRRSLERLCTPRRGLAPPRSFANAESMLAALTQSDEKPQVLLLDVGLPGRNGLDILGDIHQHAPDCRVVILTVFEDEAKISQAISAGASGYLLKTATPDEIAEASIHTADTHTRDLYSKLGVRSRAAAVARAMREKLV